MSIAKKRLDSPNNRRIDWIDAAKGIGIILVVFSHLTTNGDPNRIFMFSFHMPLFFFLSGFVFNNNHSFKTFFLKRLRALYLPYILFLIFDCLSGLAINILKNGFSFSKIGEIISLFFQHLIGYDLNLSEYLLNAPIWFMCALFFVEIYFYFLVKLPKIVPAACAVLFMPLSAIEIIKLPFCLNYFFAVSVFLILGYLSKNALITLFEDYALRFRPRERNIILFAVGLIFAVAVYFLSSVNGMVSMQSLSLKNRFFYYTCAILGIVSVLLFARLLQKVRILCFYGKNSIVILCLHYYLCRFIIPAGFQILGLRSYLYHPLTELLLLVFVMAVMYPVILFCNKHLGFLFGKKRTKETLNKSR